MFITKSKNGFADYLDIQRTGLHGTSANPQNPTIGDIVLLVGMSISEYRIRGTGSVFRIRFNCEEKLRVINLFRRA